MTTPFFHAAGPGLPSIGHSTVKPSIKCSFYATMSVGATQLGRGDRYETVRLWGRVNPGTQKIQSQSSEVETRTQTSALLREELKARSDMGRSNAAIHRIASWSYLATAMFEPKLLHLQLPGRVSCMISRNPFQRW